jgi:hypothetical protein
MDTLRTERYTRLMRRFTNLRLLDEIVTLSKTIEAEPNNHQDELEKLRICFDEAELRMKRA